MPSPTVAIRFDIGISMDMLFAGAVLKQQAIDWGDYIMTEQNPEPVSNGFDMNKSTIISLLYIASFVVGITGLIAGILAFVWKGEVEGTWEESHLQYHIMTFVVSLIAGVIGFVLIIVGIGILILLAIALWVLVRSIVALLKAQKQEPMPDPKTLLF